MQLEISVGSFQDQREADAFRTVFGKADGVTCIPASEPCESRYTFTGSTKQALDFVDCANKVEKIVEKLRAFDAAERARRAA